MAFQPCPETAEIRISAEQNGQLAENVLHCRISTTPDLTEMNAVKSVVNDWVTGPYAATASEQLAFTSITVTDLNVAGGLQVTQDLTGINGEQVVGVKTNQDTFCIKLLTGHRGRSFRGRFYMMGLAANAYRTDDPNRLLPAGVSGILSMVDVLRTDLATAAHPLGVLSRFNKDAVPTPPHERAFGLLTDVTSVAATDDIVDGQSRRMPGRGL